MKNTTKIYTLVASFALLIMSCSHTNTNLSDDLQSMDESTLFSNEILDGYIRINASNIALNNIDRFHIDMFFLDPSNKKTLHAGKVSLGNLNFEPNKNSDYPSPFYPSKSDNFETYWGKPLDIKIEGNIANGFEPAKATYKMPELIKITIPHNAFASRSAATIVKWNPGSEKNEKVYLRIEYPHPPFGNKENVDIMKGKDQVWSKLVPDNGEFSISPEIIKKFPAKGTLTIKVARFEADEIKSGTKRIGVYFYTLASSSLTIAE